MGDELTNESTSGLKKPAGQIFDVFISHAAEDTGVAKLLADRLSDAGFSVWFGEFDLRPGQHWQEQIREAIERSHVCLVLLSDATVPSEPWVSNQWCSMQESSWRRKDLSLCSVRLDNAGMPPFLRPWQSLSLDKNAKDPAALDRVLNKIILVVMQGGAGNKAHLSSNDRLATAERFAEIQKALVGGQNTENLAKDKG